MNLPLIIVNPPIKPPPTIPANISFPIGVGPDSCWKTHTQTRPHTRTVPATASSSAHVCQISIVSEQRCRHSNGFSLSALSVTLHQGVYDFCGR